MTCPTCGNADLVHDTRDIPLNQNGNITTIEALSGDYCPLCGGMVLDWQRGERYAMLLKHRQAINLIAGLWKDHEDSPIDGVEYQKKMRSQW